MTTRNLALIGLICLGAAAAVYTPPVQARTFVDLDINIAPPAPRVEPVVVRAGYVWQPGFWRWDGYSHHHVWVAGVYVRERPGEIWVPAQWNQGPHGWHFVEGHWRPAPGGAYGGGFGEIAVAPPAPIVEQVVVRPGYVWTPGYYRWDAGSNRHIWVGGVYVHERPGYVWVPHRWTQGPHGGWHLEEGHWDRR